MSSDTAARAREIEAENFFTQWIAENYVQKYEGQPVLEINSADALNMLKAFAAQSAPVEEELLNKLRPLTVKDGRPGVPLESYAKLWRLLPEIVEALSLRQHGYGAQPTIEQLYEAAKVIYSGDTRKDLFALEGLALHRHRDTGEMKYLVEALECRVTLKDFDSKFPDPLGAQGQGVGPRCPKCGSIGIFTSIITNQFPHALTVKCADCTEVFPIRDIADFAQFFSPVPSPESATPLHGICPNCGADRSGPSAEAHAANCPESATKEP